MLSVMNLKETESAAFAPTGSLWADTVQSYLLWSIPLWHMPVPFRIYFISRQIRVDPTVHFQFDGSQSIIKPLLEVFGDRCDLARQQLNSSTAFTIMWSGSRKSFHTRRYQLHQRYPFHFNAWAARYSAVSVVVSGNERPSHEGIDEHSSSNNYDFYSQYGVRRWPRSVSVWFSWRRQLTLLASR